MQFKRYVANNFEIELPIQDAAGLDLNVSSGYTCKLKLTRRGQGAATIDWVTTASPGSTRCTLGNGLITWAFLPTDITVAGTYTGTITLIRTSDSYELDFPHPSLGPIQLEMIIKKEG